MLTATYLTNRFPHSTLGVRTRTSSFTGRKRTIAYCARSGNECSSTSSSIHQRFKERHGKEGSSTTGHRLQQTQIHRTLQRDTDTTGAIVLQANKKFIGAMELIARRYQVLKDLNNILKRNRRQPGDKRGTRVL